LPGCGFALRSIRACALNTELSYSKGRLAWRRGSFLRQRKTPYQRCSGIGYTYGVYLLYDLAGLIISCLFLAALGITVLGFFNKKPS
jgi:hypothetical protein